VEDVEQMKDSWSGRPSLTCTMQSDEKQDITRLATGQRVSVTLIL
jgi:hypothetical protein